MQARSERFTTPPLAGVHLHTLHWGRPSDRPLLLLHGGGANAHWWDHIAPVLARDAHAIALDFRGHGDSDYPQNHAVGAFNDDLEALALHLSRLSPSPAEPILVGHSMGAGVALDHAARHPEVRGLVLVDVARGASRRSRRGARLALALRRSYQTRSEATSRYRFLPAADRAPESLRAAIAEHSVRAEPDGRFGFKFDSRWFTIPARPRPDLSRVRCPTLLIRGAESPMLTEEGARALVDELPDARLEVIGGAGHHVHLDRPDAFLAVTMQFLAELASAPR